MRLIDADALKKEFGYTDEWYKGRTVCAIIDNAPTVEPTFGMFREMLCSECDKNCAECKEKKPQGEREFIEIFVEYVPDDICTYPEYRGKPYYSIHYTQNGEDFVGFGTYNPKVLSRYLRDYFFEQKGGAE